MGKTRTGYSKKRKFCGNRHVHVRKLEKTNRIQQHVGRHLQVILPMMPLLISVVAPSVSARKIATQVLKELKTQKQKRKVSALLI